MSEFNLLDFIPDDLVGFYNKIQNLFPVCLKCQKPVFIQNIMDNKVVKIKIDCEYCQDSQKLTTEEYIDKLNSLLPDKFNCAEHSDKLCYGFCQECNKWFCVECFKNHFSENHTLYVSQFKIRPICQNHPQEPACFFGKDKGNYFCMKCDYQSNLDNLENNFFNNGQDDSTMGHCFRCLHYDFIASSAIKLMGNISNSADDIINEANEETKKLLEEKIENLKKAGLSLTDSLTKVRYSNILISNGFLKGLPIYHVFKNIKKNFGENHTTFWAFEDLKSKYEDNEKNMTKEIIIELIDKICEICDTSLTTSEHMKLSEENDFNFKKESDLRIKEIKCIKTNFQNTISGIFLLKENERFLIYDSNEFKIYDANTFETIQAESYQSRISYINIVDEKRFIIAIKDYYELYEFQEDGKYKQIKKINLEKIEPEKKPDEEKKKKNESDSDDDDDSNNSEDNDDKKINSDIDSIVLLKDQTKIAVGQSTLITIRQFETGKLIKKLENQHEGSVDHLFILTEGLGLNYLISCCSCNNFCFWDVDSFEFILKLEAEINSPTSYLLLDQDTLITGGSMIGYKIDLDEMEVAKDFSGNFMLLDSFAKLSDNEVLFATRDDETKRNNFYILDTDTMEYELHVKNIHNGLCQGCINLSEDKIISVSRDSTFKVWEIKK